MSKNNSGLLRDSCDRYKRTVRGKIGFRVELGGTYIRCCEALSYKLYLTISSSQRTECCHYKN